MKVTLTITLLIIILAINEEEELEMDHSGPDLKAEEGNIITRFFLNIYFNFLKTKCIKVILVSLIP